MNEKEMIKEICDDIFEIIDRRYYYDSKWNIHIDHVDLNKLAKGLIKRGYTKNKIHEGSIVLNAKDIETTCKHCRSKYEKIIEDTRKETAKEILQDFALSPRTRAMIMNKYGLSKEDLGEL